MFNEVGYESDFSSSFVDALHFRGSSAWCFNVIVISMTRWEEKRGMEAVKLETVQRIQEKGMTVEQVAEAIQFDPVLLSLYLTDDAYPVPKRIIDNISKSLSN